jgi:hypothetical protein
VIRAEDAQFHDTDPNQPTWAETNFFGFYNAEAKLNVGVYALFRTNLGTVVSTVCMHKGRAVTPWEADYVDYRASLPMPEPRDLCDYRLANGLHVRCVEPNMVWDLRYDDGQGTRIDVRYDSLMPPFDIHDPDMDPMCASKSEEGKFAWGTAYNGHFDQTGRFRGTVTLRGQDYPIDCVSTMDHSWGPRPERGSPSMSWLHAHFSEELAIHAIFGFDPAGAQTRLWLAHGYVLEKGKVLGLKAGRGLTRRRPDRYAETVELELTDRDGRAWRLKGEGMTTFPWQPWASMIGFNVLARWECDGRVGYGEIQDLIELSQLTALNSDPATRIASAPK